MRTRVGVLALLPLLSVACGTIKGGSSDAAPEPDAMPAIDAAPPGPCEPGGDPTFDEGYDCMMASFCSMISRCGPAFTALTVDECMRFSLTFSDVGDEDFHKALVRQAIEQGTVIYHPDEVAACYQTISEMDCPYIYERTFENFDFDAFCPIFSGTVAAEGSCFTETECEVPGSICVHAVDCEPHSCCVGTCVPPAEDDQPCADGVPCKVGSYCVAGTCRSGGENAPCSSTGQCDLGFWCGPDSLCVPELESGAPCVAFESCSGPEVCVKLDADKAGTCARVDQADAPCNEDCMGLYCVQSDPSALGRCVPFGDEEGGDCTEVYCRRSFECNQATNQCERLGDLGDECLSSFDDCLPGYICDREISGADVGACVERLADGELCENDDHCRSNLCGGDPEATTCQPFPDCY